MKHGKVLVASLVLAASMSGAAFAGEWKQDSIGWWYQNDDGSYPVNQWLEVDGKQYYFNESGYMLSNTITPDGKQVGADGALIVAQSLSNITYTADSITQGLFISDYLYESYGSSYHFFEITNNSPHTLRISINETAKDGAGNIIGANSASEEDIPPGCTVFVYNYFSDVKGISSFDTSIQTKAEDIYIPVLQNIAYSTTDLGDKVVVTATNTGAIPAEFTEATVLFFKNGKVVYYGSAYLVDDDYELKPGASLSEQIHSYKDYDSYKIHLTARRSKWS